MELLLISLLLVAVAVAVVAAWQWSRVLREVARGMDRLGAGRRTRQILLNTWGPVRHLIRVFNAAAPEIQGRIDRLELFRRLEFLGPHRRIRVFLDRSALFFAREERTAFEVRLGWRTEDGKRGSRRIRHDLTAYRDFPYLEVPQDG